MDTAGTKTYTIPAVVSPDGRLNANLAIGKREGELVDRSDVGILYDAWAREPDVPLALVHVTVEIDLDEVFSGREARGSAETQEVDWPED